MIKRAMCLILALAVMLSCICFTTVTSAAGTLKFKVTSGEFKNGKVTATVSITENPGLISYVLALKYDNTKFAPVYNADAESAVVDKKLFGTSMDEITSNSSGIGQSAAANLDYITAVATSDGSNVTATGNLFSIEFNVLDSSMTVFPSELIVSEAFTYAPGEGANEDGQRELEYEIINSNGIYTVKHHKELVTGGYEFETEVLQAPVGSQVTATPKQYTSHEFSSLAGNVLNGNVKMDGTLVLDCYYSINNYTVTYDYQGGTPANVTSDSVKHGQTITLPTEGFSKTDYEFKGWYTVPDGKGQEFTSTTPVTESLTLYAYWTPKPTYKVMHFKENISDDEYVEELDDREEHKAFTNEFVTVQPNTYEGFELVSETESGKLSGTVSADSSTEFKFYYKRKIYNVKFYNLAGEQIGTTQKVKYQAGAAQPEQPANTQDTEYEYIFDGWETDFSCVTDNMDIYPKVIKQKRKYKVTYNYMSPTFQNGELEKELEYNDNIVFPDESTFGKSEYDFGGWYTDIDFAESSKVSQTDKVLDNMVLYAKWNKQPKYVVEHYKENLEGDYVKDSETVFYNTVSEGVTATPKSYEGFEENTGHKDRNTTGWGASGSTTVLKLYYSRKQYTVNFYNDIEGLGSIYAAKLVKYQHNSAEPENLPVKEPDLQKVYTFDGWNKSLNNIVSDMDIYPVFKETAREYTVTYLYGEGVDYEIETKLGKYGEAIPTPGSDTFSKEGFYFAGWYTQIENIETSISDLTISGDIEVYARWTQMPRCIVEHYQENLDGSGYSLVDGHTKYITMDSGEIFKVEPEDGKYVGFYLNYDESDLEEVIVPESDDIVLRVYYDRERFSVVFHGYESDNHICDDACAVRENVMYGATANVPSAPSKDSTEQYDYSFSGWVGSFENITENLNIYPEFDAHIRSYRVNYHYQGATVYGDVYKIINYGEYVIIPNESDFENTGYNFMGWYTESDGNGSPVTDANVVTGDMDIYAYWQMPSYRVEYYKENLDGGFSLEEACDLAALIGSSVTAGDDKEYIGFSFDGTNENNVLSASVAANGSTVLKVYYKRERFSVVFHGYESDNHICDDACAVRENVMYGATANVPSAPSKDSTEQYDYSFSGWVGSFENITENLNIYPEFDAHIRSYRVNYHYQGATVYGDVYKIINYGEYVIIPNESDFENTGYNFMGWYTESDGNGSPVTDANVVTGDMDIYAYWQMPSYRVEYYKENLDGGFSLEEACDLAALIGSSVTAGDDKEYIGFSFDGTNENNVLSASVAANGSTILKVYYKRNIYTVTYNYQDATSYEIESDTFKFGQNIVLPDVSTFSKDGYTFSGWYSEPNAQGNVVNSSNTVTSDIIVYAAWQQHLPQPPLTAAYKVVYYQENLDGTYSITNAENKSGAIGATVYAQIPEISGFEFDASNVGNVLTATIASDGTTELKVYCKRKIFTVTYNYQGATTAGVASNTFKFGQTISLPDSTTFSKSGYTFGGWYTAENKAGTQVGTTYVVNSDLTIYAGWNVVSNSNAGSGGGGGGAAVPVSVTVKFNSNGGSEVESVKIVQGSKVAEPEPPTKEGYVFAGWYVDKALKTKYNFDDTLTAGMTLYAAWTEKTEDDKENQDNEDKEANNDTPLSNVSAVLNTSPGVTYIQGDDNGHFNPENKITRAEVSVMIYRLLLDTDIVTETDFVDVPHDEWYSLQVKTLASKGIIKGYDDGCFYPSRYVTRAEFATILSRLVQLENGEEIFPDVPENHWAFVYITTAYKNGWITGYENGNFGPDMNLSRAEAVTIMSRVLGKSITSGNSCKFPDVAETHWAYDYICAASD